MWCSDYPQFGCYRNEYTRSADPCQEDAVRKRGSRTSFILFTAGCILPRVFIGRRRPRAWPAADFFCGPDLHAGETHAMVSVDETLSLNSFSYSYTRGNRPPDSGSRTRGFACGIPSKDRAGAGFPIFMGSRGLGQEAEPRRQRRQEREHPAGQQHNRQGAILDQTYPEPLPDGHATGRPAVRPARRCLPGPVGTGLSSLRVRRSPTIRNTRPVPPPPAFCVLRSRRLGRSRTGYGGVRQSARSPAACLRSRVTGQGRPFGLRRRRGRGFLVAALRLFPGQSVHVGFLQEPVRSFPEFLQEPSFQQGLDLVLTGVQRLSRFLQRTEHVTHFRLLRRAGVHRLPGGFFGDLAARL
jgi:hypothetical protein